MKRVLMKKMNDDDNRDVLSCLDLVNRPSIRVRTAASLLDVHLSVIYKMVHKGELSAFRIGTKGIRIFADSLRSYQERNKIVAQKELQQASSVKGRRKWVSREHQEAMAYLRSLGVV